MFFDNQALILIGSICLSFLMTALLLLAWAYQRLQRDFSRLESEQKYLYIKAHHRANKLIDEARQKSQQILDRSQHKAQEVLLSADFLSAISQQELSKKVDEVSEDQVEEYKKVLTDLRQELLGNLKSIFDNIRGEASTEISEFRQSLTTETKVSERLLKNQSELEYQKVNEELLDYQKELMAKLDSSIYTITQRVLEKVATKTLSPAEHEAMVFKALEEAKHQHEL